MLVLKIIGAIVVVLVLAAAVLRVRKLRRDEMRKIATHVDRPFLLPPPSPYTPSKGFRLLDDAGGRSLRPEPPRPRLEPDREYVFSESQLPSPYVESVSPRGRHDEKWALAKSGRHSSWPLSGVSVLVIVLALVVVAAVGYYLEHRGHVHPSTGTTTSTSTTLAHATTKVDWPATFVAVGTNGASATYDVPASTYKVAVSGTNGPVWTVFEMGARNVLEWQGAVKKAESEALTMRGASQISLGSPKNATVTVEGRPVRFPSPLPVTLTLVFTPTSG